MIHGIKMLGIRWGWDIIDNIPGRFCKKVLRLAPSTVNCTTEHGLGRDSRTGKMFCRTAKF
jgi:hypothetical protein